MPLFLPFLAHKYSPYDIDVSLFSFYAETYRAVPIIVLGSLDMEKYGRVEVDGTELPKGKLCSFAFSPVPFLMISVGTVADEFDKTYRVKLSGFVDKKGHKFPTLSFKLTTEKKKIDDGKHTENESVAKSVADEGIVLLKNSGVLPLEKGESVSLNGAYKDYRITAIGAGLIKPRYTYSITEAFNRNGEVSIKDDADIALYFISRGSGENKDNKPIKGNYYLTDDEKAELKAITDKKRVILILNTAYPIEMSFISSLKIEAIIWTGLSGQLGSVSLVDILTGLVNPSGRLCDSWPYDYYDLSASLNAINLDENSPLYTGDERKFGAKIYYKEREEVGYRYYEKHKEKKAAFYFGEGLSYSRFSFSSNIKRDENSFIITTKVKNVSKLSGKTSLLYYISRNEGEKVFVGYDKTRLLAPEEEETIVTSVPFKDFSSFDKNSHSFIIEEGMYSLYLGGGIQNAEKIGEERLEKIVVEESISVCKEMIEAQDEKTEICNEKEITSLFYNYEKREYPEKKKYKGEVITLEDVKEDETLLDDFVSQFTLKELAAFSVLDGSCWGHGESGAAGRLRTSKRYGIPTLYMSDGNNGVNIYQDTTGFPSSNLVASTFNKELSYTVGATIAKESKEYGININLGPGGNLHRSLLAGRHPEYFSEDPILTGTMMAYIAKGEEENGVIATYKHVFGNNTETERKAALALIDEETMRNLYLRVFDKAFSLYTPGCIMTSYNPVNGIYPSESAPLLNDLIRKEWGFDGFSMTDWGAYDTQEPVHMINAGTNLLTPGGKKYVKILYKALKRGDIKRGTAEESVKRVMRVLARCI